LVEGAELGPRLDSQLGIEIGQWLIEEERVGLSHQRPGQGYPLLLATGQLPWEPVQEMIATGRGRGVPGPVLRLPLRGIPDQEPERDVRRNREVREQCVGLEHHRDVAPARSPPGDVLTGDVHPAVRGRVKSGYDAQQSGLSGARRAEHHAQLVPVDRQVYSVEYLDRAVRRVHASQD
jgi:hypothetical protein